MGTRSSFTIYFPWRQNMCGDITIIGRKLQGIFKPARFSQIIVAVFTVFILSGALPISESLAGEVWVANMKGANVQVIDTASNKVVKTIATGAGAHNVTFSPDGKLAYIANLGTNSITIIDTLSKEILADVVTDTKAHDVAVSPDGTLAVACNVGAGNITFIDVASKKAIHTMATGKKAITAVFSYDGKTLYVVNAGAANISLVDVKTKTITQTRRGAKGAMAIKPTKNWGQFWVTAPADDQLLLLNSRTGALQARIDVPGEPHGLVHSPDGKTVFVGQRKLGQIAMIDTATRKITKTMSLGQRPDMIDISSDGKTVYVAIRDENKLAVISAADLSVIAMVDTDGETHGVAYRD
jgi:YVTN family beta-propeller protein